MMDRSAREHRERMERGVGAVREYLEAQFPGYVIEVLERSSRDFDRDTRTFKARNDGENYLLREVDEVLDLDAKGVSRLLKQFGVAQALRRAGPRNAILVTTDTTRVEPISD